MGHNSKPREPREPKKPRNYTAKNMGDKFKGGPMRDRRERRAKEDLDIRRFIDEEMSEDPRPRNGQW